MESRGWSASHSSSPCIVALGTAVGGSGGATVLAVMVAGRELNRWRLRHLMVMLSNAADRTALSAAHLEPFRRSHPPAGTRSGHQHGTTPLYARSSRRRTRGGNLTVCFFSEGSASDISVSELQTVRAHEQGGAAPIDPARHRGGLPSYPAPMPFTRRAHQDRRRWRWVWR